MKLAFVAPRYGAEILAGAEHACRLLAERVAERHDVDVLTTCARDPLTWRNEYPEGVDRVRGVLVRRYAVAQPHDRIGFQELSFRLAGGGHDRQDEIEWLRRLGPMTPGLIDHLRRQHRTYDAIVYFSLTHATTYFSSAIAPDRSILFPYLTFQPSLRFVLWSDVMRSTRALGFVSGAERAVARAYLGPTLPADEVVGVGIEAPPRQSYPRHQQDPADDPTPDDDLERESGALHESGEPAERGIPFRRRHRLYGPFALYGGRVEADNGCEEMLEYFDAYAGADGDTSLVLTGIKMMKLPDAPYLRSAGVLPDRERMVAYEAADVTLAPDPNDLLALPVLQSFAVGTPVLAAAGNRAAVDHCRLANAGLYYANRDEFVEALRLLADRAPLRERLGENGRQYIRQHYRWEAVLGRFERLLGRVKARS